MPDWYNNQQPQYGGNNYAPHNGGGGYGAPPPMQQQGGWGAPPPQQYGGGGGGGYGAPPPPGPGYGQQQHQPPYGAPPQQQFNQGPPPGQWGSQPPAQYGHDQNQQQWGAPAPPAPMGSHPQQQGFGAPPPQQQQFGAPPPSQFGGQGPPGQGPRFLGVAIPAPPPAHPVSQLQGYNPQFDAERIRKATKGFGTDEKTIIDVLAPLDPFQMDVLGRNYEQMVGRSLQKTLEKELSSWSVLFPTSNRRFELTGQARIHSRPASPRSTGRGPLPTQSGLQRRWNARGPPQ